MIQQNVNVILLRRFSCVFLRLAVGVFLFAQPRTHDVHDSFGVVLELFDRTAASTDRCVRTTGVVVTTDCCL